MRSNIIRILTPNISMSKLVLKPEKFAMVDSRNILRHLHLVPLNSH
jgi:hypothetical protein